MTTILGTKNRFLVKCALILMLFNNLGGASISAAQNPNLTICHIPPGNAGNVNSITVDEHAQEGPNDHLMHGDSLGECGSVSGIVFEDLNHNKVYDPLVDMGISGVEVQVYNAAGLAAGRIVTVITDQGGQFTTPFPSGETTVKVVEASINQVKPGYILVTNNSPQTVVVVAAGNSPTTPMGYDKPQPVTGTLSGFVFEDLDVDGVWDQGELGMPGIGVNVYVQEFTGQEFTGKVVTTDNSGKYESNVAGGEYYLAVEKETIPEGVVLTTGNDFQGPFIIVNGQTVNATNIGYANPSKVFTLCPDPDNKAPCGTLNGFIFEDKDGNKLWEMPETGIAEVTVEITHSNGAKKTLTTFFDPQEASGKYTTSLLAGTYSVKVTQPPQGYVLTTANDTQNGIEVKQGETVRAADIGYQKIVLGDAPIYTLMGFVFDDTDKDGVWDKPEERGLAGVEIEIIDTKSAKTTLTTDQNGTYQMVIAEGEYGLAVSKPLPNYILSTANDKQTGTVGPALVKQASDIGYYVDVCTGRELAFGGPRPPLPCSSISGKVFYDGNKNAALDEGEKGLGPNILIIMVGPDNKTYYVKTDVSGNFTQSGLVQGSYTVTVDRANSDLALLPQNYALTTNNALQTIELKVFENGTAGSIGYVAPQGGGGGSGGGGVVACVGNCGDLGDTGGGGSTSGGGGSSNTGGGTIDGGGSLSVGGGSTDPLIAQVTDPVDQDPTASGSDPVKKLPATGRDVRDQILFGLLGLLSLSIFTLRKRTLNVQGKL